MSLLVGSAGYARLDRARGVRSLAAPSLILPGRSSLRGGGEVDRRQGVKMPVLHGNQRPGAFIRNVFGEPLNPAWTETEAGLLAYSEYVNRYTSYRYTVIPLSAGLVDPAEKWYVMIPLEVFVYRFRRIAFEGVLEGTEKGVPGPRPFSGWAMEYGSGSPPEIRLAWAENAPQPYADHEGRVFPEEPESWEPFSEGINPLERVIGEMLPGSHPDPLPIEWVGGSASLPRFRGLGNYTPVVGDAAWRESKSEWREQQEEAAEALAELLPSQQREEMKRIGKERVEADALLNEEERAAAEAAEEKGEGIPATKFLQRIELELAQERTNAEILSGAVPEAVLKKLVYPWYSNRKRWALRLPMSALPGIGKPPGHGNLVIVYSGRPGEFLEADGPGLAASGFGHRDFPRARYLQIELQKVSGAGRLAPGEMQAGAPGVALLGR